MKIETIDLYDIYPVVRPPRATGQLQMWIPETPESLGRGRRHPAVLIFPGGGYEHVSAREAEPVALRFVAQGYAAFVLTYSCGPHPFPVALREAAMAMKFIRCHAGRMEVDPAMVAAVGFSAGGHLCGTLGTLYDDPVLQDIGSAEQIRPDALGLCYPVAVSWGKTHGRSFDNLTFEDRSLRDRLSLEKLVRPDMPPVFLWHTRQDGSVPCRNSLILAAALAETDVPFAAHIYYKGPHGLSLADETAYPAGKVPPVSADVPGWGETMMEFFREQGFRITDSE